MACLISWLVIPMRRRASRGALARARNPLTALGAWITGSRHGALGKSVVRIERRTLKATTPRALVQTGHHGRRKYSSRLWICYAQVGRGLLRGRFSFTPPAYGFMKGPVRARLW